jgi:hypothetical protein
MNADVAAQQQELGASHAHGRRNSSILHSLRSGASEREPPAAGGIEDGLDPVREETGHEVDEERLGHRRGAGQVEQNLEGFVEELPTIEGWSWAAQYSKASRPAGVGSRDVHLGLAAELAQLGVLFAETAGELLAWAIPGQLAGCPTPGFAPAEAERSTRAM